MNINVTVNFPPEFIEALDRISRKMSAIHLEPQESFKKESPLTSPAMTTGTSPGQLVGAPHFATEEMKRDWLVNWCNEHSIEIPPRTRTSSLEKWYLSRYKPEDPTVGASTSAPSATEAETPQIATPSANKPQGGNDEKAAPKQEKAAASSLTKETVTNHLKQYVSSGGDEKDRSKRRDDVRALINQCGATNISELDPSYYPKLIETFKN